MSTTLAARLASYAQQTASDMGGTLAAAVESMRAESAEVARDMKCTAAEVVEWCGEHAADVMCIGCGKHLPEDEATYLQGEPGTYSGEPWFCAECVARAEAAE